MYFRNALHSFFWGIITAGMSLIFQMVFIAVLFPLIGVDSSQEVLLNSFYFLIIYAFTEEFFKYFIISKKIGPMSYGKGFLVNAWLAGVGFSLLEIFIIYQKNIQEGIELSLPEMSQTAPLHILTFGILSYQLATQVEKKINYSAFLSVFLIHFVYNYSIVNLENFSQYIVFSLILFLILINIYYFFTVNKKLASD